MSDPDLLAAVRGLTLSDDVRGGVNPLPHLPCAHHDVRKQWVCPNAGVSHCSGCHLVSYCSKASAILSPRKVCINHGAIGRPRLVKTSIGLRTNAVSDLKLGVAFLHALLQIAKTP